MRKIVWMMSVSVDGYMEGPNREIDWHMVGKGVALLRYERRDLSPAAGHPFSFVLGLPTALG